MRKTDSCSPGSNCEIIQTDLRCGVCAYNLRTLSLDGQCPECGQSIAKTVLDFVTSDNGAWRSETLLDVSRLRHARGGVFILLLASAMWIVISQLPSPFFVRFSSLRV